MRKRHHGGPVSAESVVAGKPQVDEVGHAAFGLPALEIGKEDVDTNLIRDIACRREMLRAKTLLRGATA